MVHTGAPSQRWKPPGFARGVPKPASARESTWLLHEGFRTAYTALDIETVIAEVSWAAREASPAIPLGRRYWRKRRMGRARVGLTQVLPITSPAVLTLLGLTHGDLMREWTALNDRGYETITQLIGRAARLHGFEGILCHSARNRPDGRNLVIFPDNCPGKSWFEDIQIGEVPYR
jgi:hypothetical protein